MEQENQVTDTSDQTEEVEETAEVETTEEVDYKTEAEKAKELAENYKKRAEKAERKAKEVKETPKVELTNMDILAIAKSDVHEDDIERITKFAQMEGIAVKDALAHDDMQAILERRAEARKVAAAANTGANTGGQAEMTGEGLLANAQQGKMPDAKDLTAMWNAQLKK